LRPFPVPSAPIPDGNPYRRRIRAFIEGLHLSRAPTAPSHGIFNTAFASMEAMQNTIARLKLAAYSPDVTVEIPRKCVRLF
jgi:NTE family protein